MKRRDTEKTVMWRQRHKPRNSRNHQEVEKVKRILPESLPRKCSPENRDFTPQAFRSRREQIPVFLNLGVGSSGQRPEEPDTVPRAEEVPSHTPA